MIPCRWISLELSDTVAIQRRHQHRRRNPDRGYLHRHRHVGSGPSRAAFPLGLLSTYL